MISIAFLNWGWDVLKKVYKVFIDTLETIILKLLVIVMFCLIVMNFFDYLQRYFLGKSFNWMMDLTLILGAWVFCLGFSIVIKRKESIAIEFVSKQFPKPFRKYLKVFTSLIMFLFSFVIFINSIKLAKSQQNVYIFTLKPITESYRASALVVGFLLTMVFLIYIIWDQIDELREN